jgi:hypothetical protein
MTSPNAKRPPADLLASLPEYLGLGLLDPHSVEIGLDQIAANYTVEGDLLYHVSLSDQHFQIEEFLDGRPFYDTSQPTSLQEAFFRHLLKLLPYDHRRFEVLMHRLTDGRNVLVHFASEPRYFYYPAGYLFTLRQPLVSGYRAAFEQVSKSADGGPDGTALKLDEVREGVVLRLWANGKVTAETIRLADFSATLHRVTEAADRLWRSGIVPPEKEYGLAVLDYSVAGAGFLSIWLGDPARGIAAYSVVLTEGTDWTMDKLENDFGAGACQFLEDLKK